MICERCKGQGKIKVGVETVPGHVWLVRASLEPCPDCEGTGLIEDAKGIEIRHKEMGFDYGRK